jgi:hypothetical protein
MIAFFSFLAISSAASKSVSQPFGALAKALDTMLATQTEYTTSLFKFFIVIKIRNKTHLF